MEQAQEIITTAGNGYQLPVLAIVGGVILLIICIILVAVVLSQESPKGDNLSALTGSDSYFSQNQGRTKDVVLGRIARVCLALLFVVTMVVSIVNMGLLS